jgi:hypothetical protein
LEWFNILVSVIPTDPGILQHLGDIVVKEGDRSQAFHYYSEVFPKDDLIFQRQTDISPATLQ